jgi:hypothetical protein
MVLRRIHACSNMVYSLGSGRPLVCGSLYGAILGPDQSWRMVQWSDSVFDSLVGLGNDVFCLWSGFGGVLFPILYV